MEENQRTQRKTLRAKREPTTNSTQVWQRARIDMRWHWGGGGGGGQSSYHCPIPATQNSYCIFKVPVTILLGILNNHYFTELGLNSGGYYF